MPHPDYLFKNLGAFTKGELNKLADSRVAVAGLGGYGESLVKLAMMGIGSGAKGMLRIGDPDVFERENANRQIFASEENLGRNKTEVIAEHVRRLVPDCHLDIYSSGVNYDNLDTFLEKVDLLVDAVDAMAPDFKYELNLRARQKGIPVVSAFLVFFGASGFFFPPDGEVSFDEYFAFPAKAELRQTWVLPVSRVLPFEICENGNRQQRKLGFEIFNGMHHIPSNSISVTALSYVFNWLVVGGLLDWEIPRVPQIAFIESPVRSRIIDMSEIIRRERESVWTEIAPVYDQVLSPGNGIPTVYTDVRDRICRDFAGLDKVIEAGVGTGMIAEKLARQGSESYGIDNNLGMLAYAYSRAFGLRRRGEGRMYVGEGDVQELFFDDETFDGYCSNNIFFIPVEIRKSLQEAYRVLKPGGRLAVNTCKSIPHVEGDLQATVEKMVATGLKEETVHRFIKCQLDMYSGQAFEGFMIYQPEEVANLLNELGFKVKKIEPTYGEASFYLLAEKT